MSNILTGPGWNLSVRIDGPDLVVDSTQASWFGGSNDPQDNGETASGISTRNNPGILGCALPMRYLGSDGPTRLAMAGSPIPMLPYRTTFVEVTHGTQMQRLELIDIGPARKTGHGIDITIAAFESFGYQLSKGLIPVSYRILNAATFLHQ